MLRKNKWYFRQMALDGGDRGKGNPLLVER